jgi:hypothetical protein
LIKKDLSSNSNFLEIALESSADLRHDLIPQTRIRRTDHVVVFPIPKTQDRNHDFPDFLLYLRPVDPTNIALHSNHLALTSLLFKS